MKNLKPYSGDCFSFYESVLAAKDSDELRLRLKTIAKELKACYQNYSDRFNENHLEKLLAEGCFTPHKADLLSLYNYQFSLLKSLRLEIQYEQPQAIRYTCQHCTLTSIESLDHFVPKDEFPEFAINPLNLVPSCIKCNQHKSHVWRESGNRSALNLYLDILPVDQYLFVEVILDRHNEIDFEFYLEKPKSVDDDLFNLIESHFGNLNLFFRMREKAVPVISELQNSINSRLGNLSYSEITK